MKLNEIINKLKRKNRVFIITYTAGCYTPVSNYIVIAKNEISALKKFNKEMYYYDKFISIEEKAD